ncbi:DBH-like monooxygenase 1 -like protein [Brachionus plicatilis]|uniref:DBH-like monooxygenase 1-like protein n=1 Tax=Brachionus plicatilis TaxID=10195 RepID=A0A3M7P5G0_BRAPC|nr:DBH-like monooxygenase 1 -like protein [Brachionus plicatilis]
MILKIIFVLSFIGLVCNENVPSESYENSLTVFEDDPDKLKLFWKQLENNEIQFEIFCQTTGWVGFGLSPEKDMLGDLAIGWVDNNGNPFLEDTHAERKKRPLIDIKQDWKIISAREYQGHTTIKFSRKLDTSDVDDMVIDEKTQFLLFAWNDVDPLPNTGNWSYHGRNNRIVKIQKLINSDDGSNSANGLRNPLSFTILLVFIAVASKIFN